jgi:hypothetical protein
MSLVMVAIDRRSAVVNEGSDTACDIPVAISGALVCVVEETVVCVFFVRRWLGDRVERVVYGAFEGGHLGSVAILMSVEVVDGGHVLGKRETHEMLRWQRECARQLVKICG